MTKQHSKDLHAHPKDRLRAFNAWPVSLAGLTHPMQVKPHHISRKISDCRIGYLSDVFQFVQPGALLNGKPPGALFQQFWRSASPESF